MQKMVSEQDEEDEVGPKTPKRRRIAKTPEAPEKGKTKEEYFKATWNDSASQRSSRRTRARPHGRRSG